MKRFFIFLIALVLSSAGLTNAQSFIVGDLEYGIIANTNNVIVYGHKDGNMASGGIDIPETVTYEGNTYTVTKIAPHAFEGCINLSSELVIPNTVTTICDEAFKGLRFVGPLTLGNSVESIGDFCFEGCHSISFYNNIPNSLKHIGVWAFYDTGWWNGQPDEILYKDGVCFGYKETKPTGTLVVAEGTRLIVKDAFGACGSLVSLVLPSSLEYINELAFYNCTGLTSIKSLASVPPEAIQSFEGVDKSIPVEVPFGSLSAYQNAEGWNEFTNIHEESLTNTYDFEDGTLQGWTTIDADGDGYTWFNYYGWGHNSSDHFATSESYDNSTNTALNPDNYLVSPQVNLGGSISFWACAQDANYPQEHFGVAVSTTSSTNPSAFTMLHEWTITAKRVDNREQTQWIQYTVDLGSYSGQTGYVAIRHFGCTDQYLLNVDDIEIIKGVTEVSEQNETALNVYPNPAINMLHINGLEGELVSVYDNCGRLMLQERYEGRLDVSRLPQGVYALTAAGRTVKFVKE